jgi:hypothetical protein
MRSFLAASVAASVVVLVTAVHPAPAGACSAPPAPEELNVQYEGIVVDVVPATPPSPYVWTIREDNGTTHQLPVIQLPNGPARDTGECTITFDAPVIGGRYEVIERHLPSGDITAVTSNGGSSYRLLVAPGAPTISATTAASTNAPIAPRSGHTNLRWFPVVVLAIPLVLGVLWRSSRAGDRRRA